MLVKFLILIAMIGISMLILNSANAELRATLWAPNEILLKEEYYSMVVLDSKAETEIEFDIVTDNEEALKIITDKVTIPKDNHHGLVKFETIGTGNARLYAISSGILLERAITVVESAANPTTLDLILPSDLVNVLVDENIQTGYVFLLNDFDNPVSAKVSTSIFLTSDGDIDLPKKSAVIEVGNHYTTFEFLASGEGSISASAANLQPDEEDIDLEDLDEIELIIAVGPDPIPTESSGEIYFWLEREGDPYIPAHDVKITISIDKSANLSFDSGMRGAIVLTPDTVDSDRRSDNADAREIITRTEAQLAFDSEKEYVLKKGEHYGKLRVYSSFDSADGITISGLAESIDIDNEDEESVKVSETFTTTTEKSNFDLATETRVVAYPDPAYNHVDIIVSSANSDGPVIEEDDESFTVFADNFLQINNSSGYVIKSDQNYAIVTADVIDFGDSTIFAERNESESDEEDIETSGRYIKDPELDIVTLPVLFNTEQALFLVSSSQDRITTDADEEGNLISITSRPNLNFEITRESESVLLVSGEVTEILEERPEVFVASNADTVEDSLEVYNPDRKKLNSLHPNFVYPGELFPIIKHVDDLSGNPLSKADLNVSSNADIELLTDLYYFNETGSHSIIFYDKNSVPIESSIIVKGSVQSSTSTQTAQQSIGFLPTEYEIIVHDGEGSGTYIEGEEITISAPAIKDNMFVMQQKLVGWESLPYNQAEVTFEADDDVETRPIYQQDMTGLFVVVGGTGIGGAALVYTKKIKKTKPKPRTSNTEADDIIKMLKE